jgi:hypothetical protein
MQIKSAVDSVGDAKLLEIICLEVMWAIHSYTVDELGNVIKSDFSIDELRENLRKEIEKAKMR